MDTLRTAGQGGPTAESYRFDDIVVDATAHVLLRAGVPQTVEPKAFSVLLILLRRAGELVGRDDLLDQVWGHRHVTPGVLTRVIAQLRSALGDDSHHPRYIQTQHALGYRFIGELLADEAPPEEAGSGAVPSAPAIARPQATTVSAPVPETPEIHPHAAAEAAASERLHAEVARHARRWPWLLAAGVLVAAAVATWLPQWRGGALHAAEPSIAVLPFTTLSDRTDDRYFAEGLATEMHSALAGVHGLKVATWLPPDAVKGADAKTMGERLGVATVLDASVRRDHDRVRISARLSDTRTGYTLWSRTYEHDVADVFATQSDIAQQVVTALIGVLPDSGEGLRRRLHPTQNVAAFDAYLRGVQSLLVGESDNAIASFRTALDGDSSFARAQAGICQAEIDRFEAMRGADAFDNARLACERAQKMDPTMGTVKLALGDLYRVRGELRRAREFYTSAKDDPEVASNAIVGLAELESVQGHHERAIELFGKALQVSPGNAYAWSTMAWEQYQNDDLPAAIESSKRALELRPERSVLWAALGFYHLTNGDTAESEKALQQSNALEPNYAATANLATLKYQTGDYAAAAAMYRQATQLDPGDFYPWGYLGDALIADPSAGNARDAFREAATRARRYTAVRHDDAKAIAALAWYLTNLDERDDVQNLMRRAESLGTAKGEVALLNAQTWTALGDRENARRCVETARANGIGAALIDTNYVLRRAGLARQ
ncbi:winged helix-turn-helix domain-containing protein [Lysobacter sp. LF1]|uniref:Winged helix-turn-helix domain-containing protein n=1 Tax=Lysobacter stagni TaxID=3045172 RepID=A0ABT6XKE1_9GAMM|nr:winged helix-turn-helix domain-containing protein [Lysobacter sp. LF1]MDI9240496.1 winged helix-turn-helix domain-containing protein [Lysobacter sp. LF1]